MFVLRALPLLVWCLLIFWLSSRPAFPAPMWFENQDKLYHAAAYAVMGLLFWRWLIGVPAWSVGRVAIAGMLFCSLYGASDEWHQFFVPGRDASVGDWIADSVGAWGALAVLHRRSMADQPESG